MVTIKAVIFVSVKRIKTLKITTMKATKEIKSKIFKAAWTSYRKGKKSFSKCLTSAWKWAKKTFSKAAAKFNVWSPKANFYRFYFGKNYVQVSVKGLSSYRDENDYTSNVKGCFKLVGVSEDEFYNNELDFALAIKPMGNVDFVQSKF